MFSGHNMTGRLIYQDGSGALLQQTASLAGSGQNFAHRTEAEDSALPNSRPTFNVITATTAAGYRGRWSCSLLGAAISPSLIRLRRNCSQTNGDSDELSALSVTSWLCNACVPADDHCGSTRASRGAEIMSRVAIHGFGRIGHSLMKAALDGDVFVPVSISDIKDIETLAALLEVDSNHGRWSEPVGTKREPKRVAPSRHSVRPLKNRHGPSGTKRQK
jgi:Glyceraldehyde 3-phosphate dehydrogenase, NAD binding domain